MSILKKLLVITASGITFFSEMGHADAVVLQLVNPSKFSGSETLITFEGATDPLTSFGGVEFQLSTGGGPDVWYEGTLRQFGPQEITAINNFAEGQSGPTYPDLTITFPNINNRLGFELRTTRGDNINLTFRLAGTVVESFTATTRGLNRYYFYGFETTSGFDQVVLDVQENTNGIFALDNLRSESAQAVPFELSPGLGSLGLAACGAIAYFKGNKKRRASAKVFSKD